MFNDLAPKYDRMNHWFSFNIDKMWRRKALCEISKGSFVLDEACGTADFSIAAIKQGAAKVIGVDITENMVDIGRAKVAKARMSDKIELIIADGSLFLRGRSKCMILGPSGQNIYPEEVEAVLDARTYIMESLVIEDKGGLTALVYPDYDQGAQDGMDQEAFVKFIESTLAEINKELPAYSRLARIEVMSEPFERTPKKSIKRYLYQRK